MLTALCILGITAMELAGIALVADGSCRPFRWWLGTEGHVIVQRASKGRSPKASSPHCQAAVLWRSPSASVAELKVSAGRFKTWVAALVAAGAAR